MSTEHSTERILDKIKKCLALSASANEHEAAAALRQAQKLMDAYGISAEAIQASEASERQAKAGACRTPANWETMLAAKIADAFGCRVIFFSGRAGAWNYIGCGAAPEVAGYTFAVLFRQARRAREAHIKASLKRCKVATKTRRADLFSEGWVRSVVGLIATFAGNAQQAAAIDAYVGMTYPALRNLNSRDRNDGRKMSAREYDDFAAGHKAGKSAELNRGVGGGADRARLGSAL